ncbi:NAD(P)-dependent dehydrogenase [Nocardioides gansuensis]|uniref:NAD(P)-dependent dehydrogenase n=1 Tax=Nocardioides gansuensis TaxID=2138300 RepID=A0A2T8FB19_9ACTN|nr:SDR family oxidoreductase [Nocardioides gansuensis]PVG82893.1 NAD(P)-dependent dehydrogenase [Nocardioides gansuensis]
MPEAAKPDVVRRAESMVRKDDKGGFPPQEQDPPGLTGRMDPIPDHGEETWVGRDRLTGLKALVTGADSGIGRAVAIAFAREGADVAISYLEAEQEDAEETARLVREAGRNAVLVPGDLVERETCEQVVTDAVEGLGGLDILVNNAGFHWARDGDALDGLTPETVERTLRTNFDAILWLCKAAAPHLGDGASIINTSSVQAYDPSTPLLDYAATKAAVNNLTVNLAAALGPRGIRVNAVAPGPVWTPLQPATRRAQDVEKFGAETPLGRAAQPSELAGAYVFLASPEEASYVSGTVIGVTGGRPVF